MDQDNLEHTARALIAPGRGILAADESIKTLTKRFDALAIPSTVENRRDYRQLLFSTPGLSQYISGAILFDETIRQADPLGLPLAELLSRVGIIPGIKVDLGAKALAGCPGETVTEGLDGLRARLVEYRRMGARFAKWRAVFHVSEVLPSETCLEVNAHALARYAALCQEARLVPIVEPEVLMDGAHSLVRCAEVTDQALERVFVALRNQRVELEGMLLKPNVIVPGKESRERASVGAVAAATLRVLRRQVPAAVPGIVFLSGGQDPQSATVHLQAMNAHADELPWRLSYSYGRALQDPAMLAWHGQPGAVAAAQSALHHRAACNSAASLGVYEPTMERTTAPPAPMTTH